MLDEAKQTQRLVQISQNYDSQFGYSKIQNDGCTSLDYNNKGDLTGESTTTGRFTIKSEGRPVYFGNSSMSEYGNRRLSRCYERLVTGPDRFGPTTNYYKDGNYKAPRPTSGIVGLTRPKIH